MRFSHNNKWTCGAFHSLLLEEFTSAGPDRYQNMARNIAAVAAADLGLVDFDNNLGAVLAVAGKQSAGTAAAAESIAGYLHAVSPQEVSNVVESAAAHIAIDHTPGVGTAAASHTRIATGNSQAPVNAG